MMPQAKTMQREPVSPSRGLGWRDHQGWISLIVLLLVLAHQLASDFLPQYMNPLLAGLVTVTSISILAVRFGLSLLGSHRGVREELKKAAQDKDALNEETSKRLRTLDRSIVEITEQNEQLRLLGAFNQRIHSCDSEHDIVAVAQELLPPIVKSRAGVLYCPTPEGTFKRTAQWPPKAPFAETIHPERCEALRKVSRLDGEFAPCSGCNLADPTTVACIPLRLARKTTGLLQLTFADSQSRVVKRCRENSIGPMAADHLALALLNATARRNLGDKVMRDGLTGLFNRRYMEEALQREISRSLRSKTPLSVLMLDLDHFKQLNDTMGHAAGDRVLKELAKVLTEHVRPSDIVCRYGGEEFLIALPDTSSVAAKGRADELRRHIHEISKVVKHQRVVSASIGVAAMPEHGSDLKTLLRAADNALYDAKHSGRDRTVIAASMKAYLSSNFAPAVALATK